MHVAVKTAGNYKTLRWLSRLGEVDVARYCERCLTTTSAKYYEFASGNEQASYPSKCSSPSLRRVVNLPKGARLIRESESSSRLRITLGFIHLAFGILLLGDHGCPVADLSFL